MGEVYRARDPRLGRDVAIKVIAPSRVSSPDAIARFETEARAIAAVSHPHIVAIHDVGTDNGRLDLVQELCEGETLRERLDRGPIPWRKAAYIGAAIA
jgi:serine/threonine protein kinase